MSYLVRNHSHHVPHNYMLAKALPDIQFECRNWYHFQRPLPPNIRLKLDHVGDEYDAFMFCDPWYEWKLVKAKRYIFCTHIENDPGDKKLNRQLRAIAEHVDAFVTVSKHKRSQIPFDDTPNMRTISFGVETDFLKPDVQRGIIGSVHINVPGAPCISRLLPLLCKQIPNFRLIGQFNDGVDCCEVAWPVSYEEYRISLASLSVFINPICGNVFGFTPIEAMACGLPVVTGANKDIPDWCRESPGFFVSERPALDDPQWLIDKAKSLANAPDLARTLGGMNREAVMQRATLSSIARQWREALTGQQT